MNPTELALVLLLAAVATAVALDALQVPAALLHSSVSQAFLLIMALVLFAYSPVVGIAGIALFAIVIFKRNVQKTSQYAHMAIFKEKVQPIPGPVVTQPREYHAPEAFVESFATPEEVGTYPLGPRPTADPMTLTAMYKPTEDMGDNAFVPTPSTLDVNRQSFAY